MKYFIGIDGGGTKTAFACYDEKNNLIGERVLPSCHILQVDEARAVEILKTGVEALISQILENNPQIYICAGLAGYGKNMELRGRLEKICSLSFAKYRYMIESDADIALAGALDGADGILVIVGTGSIALSKSCGKNSRCGGWGYILGDEASAYYMAKQLLAVYTKQCDGRIPETRLKQYVKEKCGLLDDYDIIAYIAEVLGNERDKIAKLSLLVYELARQNEPYALDIYENSAREIVVMINTLASRFDGRVVASYAGGVWNAGDILIDRVKPYLAKNVDFKAPRLDPVRGACILARDRFL